MELYILSKQDLSILSICKLADYQINLDEEINAKSTFSRKNCKNNVVERLTTKSHFGDRSELVILINKDIADGNTLQ